MRTKLGSQVFDVLIREPRFAEAVKALERSQLLLLLLLVVVCLFKG